MDLLKEDRIEKAAIHNGWKNLSPGIRAIWTTPINGEEDAPRHRIIHCRLLQLHSPARLHRLGLRPALGYIKCGSRPQIDWVTDFRLLLWNGNMWEVFRREQNLVRPGEDEMRWFDLGGTVASAAIVEARRCEIDRWWTSWNLVQGAFTLEGEMGSASHPQKETRLTVQDIDLSRVPSGVTAERKAGEVRFRTSTFEVGFYLGRAGFSFFGLDEAGQGRTERNFLRYSPAVFLQGIRFRPVGTLPVVTPLVRNDVTGTIRIQGTTVRYNVLLNNTGQKFSWEWRILKDRMEFQMRRDGETPIRVWESSAWSIVCQSEVTPTAVLGHITRQGETGLMRLPVLFHAPGHGTMMINLLSGEGMCRSDSSRPLTFMLLELKVGEIPQPEGDYLLPAGKHHLVGELICHRHKHQLHPDTPAPVALALQRCSVTSMTYRADTGTLSNNGCSMHAPLCMDNWSDVATRIGELLPGLLPVDLLRDSLERWLNEGPGYASGGMTGEGEIHPAEDEYIMTGTAGLLGLAEYLNQCGEREWLHSFAPQIGRQLALMRRRDVDNDGIVECRYRHGISGGHQWSTGWYDVVSFGWKDAFSNALLYRALVLLSGALPRLGKHDLAVDLQEWAKKLKEHYMGAFFNDQTGWLAGWRDRKGVLHDFAFLAVNGAAVCSRVVDGEHSITIIRNLWNEAQRVHLPDPRLGLPGNLWPIPDTDMVELMHGKPMGHYINGGLTHSQSRHFVRALYEVGMTKEGDELLEALCETLADGTAFGGCGSGVDWHYWDGGPCGYEGLLTDQFGILAVALDRYRLSGDVRLKPTMPTG